jgi:hypothetical protein
MLRLLQTLTDGDGLQFLLSVHQGLLLAMIHQ